MHLVPNGGHDGCDVRSASSSDTVQHRGTCVPCGKSSSPRDSWSPSGPPHGLYGFVKQDHLLLPHFGFPNPIRATELVLCLLADPADRSTPCLALYPRRST